MNIQEYISSGTLELYVMQALSPEEMQEVANIAAQHSEVANEVLKIEEAIGTFVMAQEKAPRAELKAQIMRKLESEIVSEPTVQKEAIVKTMAQPANNTFKYLAAASITVLLVSNVFFASKWKNAESELNSLISQKEELAQTNNLINNKFNKTFADLQVATSHSFKVVQMKGLPIAPEATADVYWNQQTKETFVDVKNMPVPAQGKQYQLWALVDGKPIDVGVFDVNGNIIGMQKVKDTAEAQVFAVTLEPTGGSISPTMDQLYVMAKI
jgi:anti-sigma-K factor RskA